MTEKRSAEELVLFSGPSVTLAGILTIPANPNGRTVVIPWGGGAFPSSGRNRIRTRLARTFADLGFHAFRFDYIGVGESSGTYREPNMESPYIDEILASCNWLWSRGLRRIILVGFCFGAWSSLMAAPLISGLEAIALIQAPVRRDHTQVRGGERSLRWLVSRLHGLTLSTLRDPRRRARYRKLVAAKARSLTVSPTRDVRFSRAIIDMLDRGIAVLLMYGDDDFRGDFEVQLKLGLGKAIEAAGPPTRVAMVAERLDGLGSLAAQDILAKEVTSWLQELPDSVR